MAQDQVYALVRTTYPDCWGAPCVDEMRAKLTGPTNLRFEMTDEGPCPVHGPIAKKAETETEARAQKAEPEANSGSKQDAPGAGAGAGASVAASADPRLNISAEAASGEKEE
ncbi:hypothetical protein G647_10306 [Cladophialophora carrionii CBS 160.54]|uniref:Uncharacterized protein n=1 Tax=Cladophialophora carrionii CBS 160.54 TaxID=1279043 RepID=V9DJ44_9EURO|nr:uncharacterized protein G647_10306 [Cladophialophora carrionii CBS 160.54]ETI26860.1 hypothetical protein G647_10306 [Cladophialophora carrionii CBS 160.54]